MAKTPPPPKPGRALKKGEVPTTPEGAKTQRAGEATVKTWSRRLTAANKDYDGWAKDWLVKHLRRYYHGKQWRGLTDIDAERKYTVNLTFATVETQLPSLLFSAPVVKVEARPNHTQTTGSDASARASDIEQMLQTFIDDRDVHFAFVTTLALHEAYSEFGLVEVGYSADWVDNPHADKPVLKDDDTALTDGAGEPVKQSSKVIKRGTKESVYIKRIPARTFRCSPGRNLLAENDWVGYYQWVNLEDVKQNPNYSNTASLKATGHLTGSDSEDDRRDEVNPSAGETDLTRHEGQVKVWKVWDLRAKQRLVLADGHATPLQVGKPFTHLPLAAMKFYEILDAFYPLPPIFNWLGPQDEINETREGMRTHRRRFMRRYMREPSVKVTEFEKLENGEDGVCIEVPKVNPSPIMPIPDADLSRQNTVEELGAAKDDLQQVSGASGEARGVPEADTATQANIINVRQQVRESRARQQVATWLGDICRLMLLTIRESMQLPMMVKQSVDPFRFGATDTVARQAQTWRQIQKEDVDDLDVDIKIDITSLSPVAEDIARQQWTMVLQLLTNQPLLMILMTPNPEAPEEPSPLLRKTLALNGIKSDAEVREIWRVGQEVMKQMAMMAMATAAAKGGMGGGGGLAGLFGGGAGGGLALPGMAGKTTGTPAAGMGGA